MPQTIIDTTDQQYQRHLTRFQDLRTYLRPRLRIWTELDDDQRERWLDRDPLLRQVFRYAEHLAALDGDA